MEYSHLTPAHIKAKLEARLLQLESDHFDHSRVLAELRAANPNATPDPEAPANTDNRVLADHEAALATLDTAHAVVSAKLAELPAEEPASE